MILKKEARSAFLTYLKERNIQYYEYMSDGNICIVMHFQGYVPDSKFYKCKNLAIYT